MYSKYHFPSNIVVESLNATNRFSPEKHLLIQCQAILYFVHSGKNSHIFLKVEWSHKSEKACEISNNILNIQKMFRGPEKHKQDSLALENFPYLKDRQNSLKCPPGRHLKISVCEGKSGELWDQSLHEFFQSGDLVIKIEAWVTMRSQFLNVCRSKSFALLKSAGLSQFYAIQFKIASGPFPSLFFSLESKFFLPYFF